MTGDCDIALNKHEIGDVFEYGVFLCIAINISAVRNMPALEKLLVSLLSVARRF